MKRWLAGISVLTLVSVGLVTGCSNVSNNQTANNAAENTTQNTDSNGGGTTQSNTAATGNTAGSQTASVPLTDARMKTIAKQMVDKYLQSHNDKTAAQYKVDITQILIPGLAAAVSTSAQSGIDFNHPIKSSTVDVTTTQYIDEHDFGAQAKTHIEFADGKTEDMTYHLYLTQNQSTNQWLIRAIG